MKDETKSQYDIPIAGHEYDGIQEFDNPLPRWWVQMFYLTIAFAIGYYGYYEFGPGKGLSEEFEQEFAANQIARAQKTPSNPSGSGEGAQARLVALVKDPSQREKGKAVYTGKCASCHGPQGQGSIGPNLTDDHWIHGGSLADIAKSVSQGVPDKGMPPWKAMLSPEELDSVVVYVKSIKGTQPPNPKAPQGEVFKE